MTSTRFLFETYSLQLLIRSTACSWRISSRWRFLYRSLYLSPAPAKATNPSSHSRHPAICARSCIFPRRRCFFHRLSRVRAFGDIRHLYINDLEYRFPIIGGLQTIPDDIKSAAIVFNVRGFRKFWYITLPAILPFVITGSLLCWAQGWTVVIVAEVLHTYIPHGTASQDLLGLGSLLVDSNAEGRTSVFVAALVAMILLVTVMNFLIWQPLLHFAQRFRFD